MPSSYAFGVTSGGGSGSGVNSITNADGSLTFSSSVGAVVANVTSSAFVSQGTGSSVTTATIPTNPTAADASQQPANDAFVQSAILAATVVQSVIIPGSGSPASVVGQNNDLYLDESTLNLWGPKTAGAWPAAASVTISTTPNYGGLDSAFIAGRWYPGMQGTGTPSLLTVNTAYVKIMPVNKSHTFQAIGLNTTTAGSVGTYRFGIYADNGSGYPGSLVLDFGLTSTPSTAVTGAASVAASVTLSPGLYWNVVVAQGGTTQPTVTTINSILDDVFFGAASAGTSSVSTGYTTGSISGALPATFPGGGGLLGLNQTPLIQLKA